MSDRASHRADEHPQSGEIDLRALGVGVWRRRAAILVPTLIVAALAVAFVQIAPPYYRSSSLVLIENKEPLAPRPGSDREPQLPDDQAVATQVQFIQSRDLVRRVVATLDLGADPEFAPDGDGSFLRKALRAIGLAGPAEDLPIKEQVVDKVAKNLAAYPVPGARVVGVEFISKNPDSAARIANGFIDAYFDIQRDAKRDLNRQATQYLGDEIAGLRTRVGEAEDRVENFRAKAGLLVGSNNTTVAAQQLGESNTQLTIARTQQAEARAKSDQIRTQLRAGRPAEALDIANSELVRALAQQRSQLVAQIASEGRTLLSQHPRMKELDAQLSALDGQIRNEAEKLARAFENEERSAGARVAAFEVALEQQKKAAATANGQDVQLRALEREARAQRELLETLLARYREANARANPEALVADARIISRAAAPTEPYFPIKLPTVLLATFAAFALALFAAVVAELFGGPARRHENGDAAPPPTVGEPPVYGRSQGLVAAQPEAAERASSEPVLAPPERAEAIEVADATLLAALARQLASMPNGDGALRILATGATRDITVGGVVTDLVRAMSETGRRVVAVDGGGGSPLATQTEAGAGLAELLTGSATFAQAIHRDRGSRVHVVPHGGTPFASLDEAARGRLGVVLEALALTYDFVLLTAPGGAGGAEPFASECAAAILVSRAHAGDAETVDAHDRLKATGIDDVVVLLLRSGDGAPDGASRLAA